MPSGSAFADALLELIEDEEKRRRLGVAGLETARRYELGVVGRELAELLRELVRARNSPWSAENSDPSTAVGTPN